MHCYVLNCYQGVEEFGELPLTQRVCMEAAGGFAAGLVLPLFFTPIELVKVRPRDHLTTLTM